MSGAFIVSYCFEKQHINFVNPIMDYISFFITGHLESWHPDETLQKCSYQYIPSMYWYMSVRKHINSMYLVCTSTGFSYLYAQSMYILKVICESMCPYVLAWDTTVFRGVMKSPCDQMLQDTFHWYMRAYLSVLFKKILCWPVGLYTWFGLGMYNVHTRSILVITGTNMYQRYFNFQSGSIHLVMLTSLRSMLPPVNILSKLSVQYNNWIHAQCINRNALVCTMYVQCMNRNALVCTMYVQCMNRNALVCAMYVQSMNQKPVFQCMSV